MSEKILFVVIEPLFSRILGVYSNEEKARNRVTKLKANKNIVEANISQCELDKDIEINVNIIQEDATTSNSDKATEHICEEDVKKFRDNIDELFRNLSK